MLTITIVGDEYFDEESSQVYTKGDIVVDLEHSLFSISKWEEIYEKPFLGKDEKTSEEVMTYIWCMVRSPGVTPEDLQRMSQDNLDAIQKHMDAKRTATWFRERPERQTPSSKTITSELIYHWLTVAGIDWQVQHWHLNRLFTQLKIFNAENEKPTKRSTADIGSDRRAENAARKAKLKTRG